MDMIEARQAVHDHLMWKPPVRPSRRPSPVVAVAALVAVLFIGAGLLIATLYAPNGRDTSAVVGFVTAAVGPTVVALLTLARGDRAAKLGVANADKLDSTIATVEQVAKDVNGHLQRHDALAANVMTVATGVAAAAGVVIDPARDMTSRSRADDLPGSDVPGADAPPLAPQI